MTSTMLTGVQAATPRMQHACGRPREPMAVVTGCLALLLAGRPAVAQTADTISGRKDVYAELAKAPEKAAARRNPLEQDPGAPAAGAKLFRLHCADCHGETGEGGRKGPGLRAPQVQQASPGALFWLLTNGVVRRGMPVWSKLPEPQRWQLVSYIKSLRPSKPADSPNPP